MDLNLKKSLKGIYSKVWDNYEKFLIIPIILISITGFLLVSNYSQRGEFISKGIDFTGGTEITIPLEAQEEKTLVNVFSERFANLNVRTMSSGEENWVVFETTERLNQTEVEQTLQENDINASGISTRSLGAAVSESFLREAQIAVLVAFIIMSIVIFIAFRSLVPSLAVILSAFTDIFVTIGGMSLFGIDLTLGSLAALLMLVGYSVDTDILLSTRLIKRRSGSLKQRNLSAMKTGLTFSIASLTAFTVLLLVSTSSTLDAIASVLIIGLLVDIPSTWSQNSIILKNHLSKK